MTDHAEILAVEARYRDAARKRADRREQMAELAELDAARELAAAARTTEPPLPGEPNCDAAGDAALRDIRGTRFRGARLRPNTPPTRSNPRP